MTARCLPPDAIVRFAYALILASLGMAAGSALGQAQAQSAPAAGQDSTTASQPAGSKLLTLDAIYGPAGRVDFDGTVESGFTWLDDGQHFLHRRAGVVHKVEAVSGEGEPAYDTARFEKALKAVGFDDAAAQSLSRTPTLTSEDRKTALLARDKQLYLYRYDDGSVKQITQKQEEYKWMTLSPKARYVSLVRDHDLHVIDTQARDKSPRKLTKGGNANLLNAELDWVYAEELYTHATRGYWWSPDEKYIAFIQLSETGVPHFTVVDHFPSEAADAYRLKLEQTPYPKAGDPNPTAKLGVVQPESGLFGGGTTWVDLSKYQNIEFLIVRVGWSPHGLVCYQIQDREQTWLDLNMADPKTGKSWTLFRETSPAWVDVLDEPVWLKDGSFLWRSQRDGWAHLYQYRRRVMHSLPQRFVQLLPEDEFERTRITSGDWEVRDVHGVDEKNGWVYFSGTRDRAIESHAYRVRLDGADLQRLTEPGYNHRVQFDPRFNYFIDTYSNITTPPKVCLRSNDGPVVRVISENKVTVLSDYKWGEAQLLRLPARDGYMMNALIITPPDMDPSKKYPVWSYTYSGPHAPSVSNNWWGGNYLLNQLLAQKGYVIWICDNRSASGQGAVSAWQNYLRLGETELADLEDGFKWLMANYPVDPERIGLYGHSYGGFQTSYALTHSKLFKIGVAGAPVTDWRCYDTIYTERYMRTPQNNPDGYERTAPSKKARDLHGKLLIMHGIMDDNVHLQNTVQFINNLEQAGKQFEMMLYPRARHGLHPPRHVVETRLHFIFDNL